MTEVGYYCWKEANRLFQCTGIKSCGGDAGWRQTEMSSVVEDLEKWEQEV